MKKKIVISNQEVEVHFPSEQLIRKMEEQNRAFKLKAKLDIQPKREDQKKNLLQLKDLQNIYSSNQKNLRLIPQLLINQIIAFQVDEKSYRQRYSRPSYPGGGSGVTIGIGYDLGYASKKDFTADWSNKLSEKHFKRLISMIGLTGDNADDVIGQLNDIQISWSAAKSVFINSSLPKFQKMTQSTFLGHEQLSDEAFGALVSLVYNRGPSINQNSSSRREMLNIHKALKGQLKYYGDIHDYIADQVRSMKRLWQGKGLQGLIKRREKEAQIIQKYKLKKKY